MSEQMPPESPQAWLQRARSDQTRYPGEWEPITDDEAHSALGIAARVLTWVEGHIEGAR